MLPMDREFTQIRNLLAPGKRRQAEARNRMRQFLIIEDNIAGESRHPSEESVNRAVQDVKEGKTWQDIFPGISTIRINSEGSGPTVSIRFTRDQGAPPVRVIREGEVGADDALIVREVDLLDRFSLNLTNTNSM